MSEYILKTVMECNQVRFFSRPRIEHNFAGLVLDMGIAIIYYLYHPLRYILEASFNLLIHYIYWITLAPGYFIYPSQTYIFQRLDNNNKKNTSSDYQTNAEHQLQ